MVGMPQFPTPVPIPLGSLTIPPSSHAPPPWGKIKCKGLQALQGVFSHPCPTLCPSAALLRQMGLWGTGPSLFLVEDLLRLPRLSSLLLFHFPAIRLSK